MKLLFVLAICSIAFAARHNWNELRREEVQDSYYVPQREYQYLYNGQISTGLPEGSDQLSVTRLQALVSFILKRDERVAIMQLRNIRIGSANCDVPEPFELVPFKVCEEEEINDEQEEVLHLPVRCTYVNGIISEIEFDRSDKPWSKNIKRGVLNMLQVNLKKTSRKQYQEEDVEDEVREDRDFFITQEKTLEGDCETAYTVNTIPRSTKQVLNVTKSINFEKCNNRVDIRYNFRFGEVCKTCEDPLTTEDYLTKSSTVMTYGIIGTKEKFLIENVCLKSQYVFAPVSNAENCLTTNVVAKLLLMKAVEVNKEIAPPECDHKETLCYNPEEEIMAEKFYMYGDEQLVPEHPYKLVQNKPEIVQQIIRRMVHAMSDNEFGIDVEAANQMTRLVEILRMCSRSEIRKIHQELYEESGKFDEKTAQKCRDILIDALSIAATKNTIEHLIEKIETRKVPVLKAAKALQNLVNVPVPSEKQIDMVIRLCKTEFIQRNPIVKQSCLLACGGMINALCSKELDNLAVEAKTEICPRQVKQKYADILFNLYRDANCRYEKVLVLKTLANAGLDVSVVELEKIIRNRQEEPLVRTQAIDALRKLRSVMPRKVQRVLMPIFKSRQELPEIRMTALNQLIHTLPERPILDQIVECLYSEPSRQVRAFILTVCETFAQSRNPFEVKLAEDLKTALHLAPEWVNRWSDSKFLHLPLYTSEHQLGVTLDLATMFGKEGILPRELMVSLDAVFGGQWHKFIVQLGFIQYNGEQLLDQLLKVTRENLAQTGSVQPQQLLRELYNRLNIRERSRKSEPHAMLCVRYKDLDFAILPLDCETIPEALQVLRQGKVDFSQLQQFFTHPYRLHNVFSTFLYETSRRIPTSLGIPLVTCGRLPTLLAWDGEVKVEVPSRQVERLEQLKLHIRGAPKLAALRIFSMRTVCPIVNNGFKAIQSVKLNLPLDVACELSLQEKLEIKYSIKVPETKQQILSIQSRLMSIISNWPTNAKTYVEPKIKTVHLEQVNQRTHAVQTVLCEKWCGVRFELLGHYCRNPMNALKGLLFNENVFEIVMEPTQNAPREIAAKIVVDLIQKQESMLKPEMENFFEEDEEQELLNAEIWPKTQQQRQWQVDDDEYEQEDGEELPPQRKEFVRKNQQQRRQEFKQDLVEYSSQNALGLRVRVNVQTVGGSLQRKGEFEIQTLCDPQLRFCKTLLEGRRSPLFEDETREWTIRAKVQCLYPKPVPTIKQLLERKHREFNALVECEWGCERKQFVNLKIQGEQSREQQKLLENVNMELKPVERYEQIQVATQLNQYKVVADYRLSKPLLELVHKAVQLVKLQNLLNVDLMPQQQIGENKMFAKLTIDPHSHQHCTLLLQTPWECIQINDIQLPFMVAPLMVNIHQPQPVVKSFSHFVKNIAPEERAECKVDSQQVNTFDDVQIRVPLTTCYSVVAKDCSSQQPKFAILLKKLTKGKDLKKLKIIDQDRVIEIEPAGSEQPFKIWVDGNLCSEEQCHQQFDIELKDDMVIVQLEDVLCRFDGYTVSVKVSELLKEELCGLCGHYDDQKENELRKANNEWTDDISEFHKSYFNQDEDCEIEQDVVNEKSNYWSELNEEDEFRPQREQTKRQPVLKTKVLEYSHELCFSTKPVPQCPEGTYEQDTVEKTVSYACVRRSQPQASQLARRARTQVLNMEKYQPSFVETINVPQLCVAY